MRLLLICLFLSLSSWLSAQGLQEIRFTNTHNEQSLGALLDEIEEQTGLHFSFSSSLLNKEQKIHIPTGTYPLQALLNRIFHSEGIVYSQRGTQLILSPETFSETPMLLSGIIIDSATSVPLMGAAIYFPELKQGVTTDATGHFQFRLLPGVWQVEVSLLGYKPQKQKLLLPYDTVLQFSLSPGLIEIGEVVVYDQQQTNKITSLSMGKEQLNLQSMKSMPAVFGEADILKSLQLLPGVQATNEGLSGLLVRGGSADQTLVMLNEATVYSPAHFLGFFSVFNPEAIQKVEIYKGGIPARWGGRLASIVNNEIKTGDKEKWKFKGGVGLISSRLTVEGPLLRNKASILLSARRSYFDLLLKAVPPDAVQATALYFYDLNGSLHLKVNKNNQLRLSAYSGKDVAGFQQFVDVKWGNEVYTAEWLHAFNSRLLLNTAFHYSAYGYGFHIDVQDEVQFDWTSRLKEYSARFDFEYSLNKENLLQFGYNASRRVFSPIYMRVEENNTTFGDIQLDEKHVLEHALYIHNQHELNSKLSLVYGLRYSLFHNLGPGRVFRYENDQVKSLGTISDTLYYNAGQIQNTYHGPEPRIIGRYLLSEESAVKFSYNRMQQYSQVASSATASLPTDRWIPADRYIKPQRADQWSLGYFRNLPKQKLAFSAEFYYKYMRNQIDFRDGVTVLDNLNDENSDVIFNNAIETQLLSGRAWSYDLELMVEKKRGNFSGWLAYTLSRTRRQVHGINQDKPYSPRYDRPHDLSLVATYKFNKRLELSGNWVFTSGHAVTLPEGKYSFEGRQIPYYNPDQRNSSRMPNYHRLDLALTLKQKKNRNRNWQGSWSFSLYNTYFRKNPVLIQFVEVVNNDPLLSAQQVPEVKSKELKGVKVFFTLIPAISYNFSF